MRTDEFTSELEKASERFASLYANGDNSVIYRLVFTAGAVWLSDYINRKQSKL